MRSSSTRTGFATGLLLGIGLVLAGPTGGRAAVVHVDIYGLQGDDSRGHAEGQPFDTTNPTCTGTAACAYAPAALDLTVGDSLEFANRGKFKHTATGDLSFAPQLSVTVQPSTSSNDFSTGKLETGESRLIGPFGLSGALDFYCEIHGPDQMQGRLNVAQAVSTTTTTSTAPSSTTSSSTTLFPTTTTSTTTTLPPPVHDLVVQFDKTQPTFTVGQTVQVRVVVTNAGSALETAGLTLSGDINYSSSQTVAVAAGQSSLVTFDYPVPVRLQVTLTATGTLAAGLTDATPANNSETKTYSTSLTGSASRTFDVQVSDGSPWFVPMRLSVTIGDTVRWTNRSAGTHTVTSLQLAAPTLTDLDAQARMTGLALGGAFDRRAFLPGESFSVLFDQPGTFPYICFIHPYMAGNVTAGLPGVTVSAGPVPDILQGPATPAGGLPGNNGYGVGVGEVCVAGGFEQPSALQPPGVVHCLDAQSFADLPLAAFDADATAAIRTLGPADTSVAGLVGRRIGGRFEGIENVHDLWYSRDGQKMFVTEGHGSNFWTIDRMTNTVEKVTPVFTGADVTHVMTTLPGEAVGLLTLEGGTEGGLGLFDPATSTMTQVHSFGPMYHPHGPWISCAGGGNGGGVMVVPFPMANAIGFANLPATPDGPVTERTVTASPGVYPVATGARSDCTKAYTANALSGTLTVNDILSGAVLHVVELPACTQCTFMGGPTPSLSVPMQVAASPDNRYVVVALAKASGVAIIDATSDVVVAVADCGSGCHGVNMGARKGGGFYAWVSMQYQDKVAVLDMESLGKAGDVPVNVRSLLTLQGLTPLGLPTAVVTAEGTWGGMGIAPFPLPAPWHQGVQVTR